MENFWTSNKHINGLRHFVLVNNEEENSQKILLMVSVVDCEINLKITLKELLNSGNWQKGWLNLPKNESITEEYFNYKSNNKIESVDEIFVNEDSFFNIA